MTRLRVLVVANDAVGERMAGPAIRSLHFARELARRHDVTLAVPTETDLREPGVRIVHAPAKDDDAIRSLLRRADAVVAQWLTPATLARVARSRLTSVYDLYAPVVVESLALDADRPDSRHRRTIFRTNALQEEAVLRFGNAFVCASDRQRDFWLGELTALGRVDRTTYRDDPSLRNLVDVVPFGIDPAPAKEAKVVKGVLPGIGVSDTLLVWPGGIWNWFDPLTVIAAVARVVETRPDVKLLFLGVRHPNPAIEEMEMADRARRLADDLGLTDRVVFFNESWVPYEQRGAYLLEADVAVSAHFDTLETRLSFRTRLLDCFWASLPIVTTEGDVLGDRAAAAGGALTVPAGDSAAFAENLLAVLGDAERRRKMSGALEPLRDELVWPRVTRPLERLVEQPGERVLARRPTLLVGRHLATRARWSIEVRGPIGFLGHGLARLRSRPAPPR